MDGKSSADRPLIPTLFGGIAGLAHAEHRLGNDATSKENADFPDGLCIQCG
jgi:hypothetical protein